MVWSNHNLAAGFNNQPKPRQKAEKNTPQQIALCTIATVVTAETNCMSGKPATTRLEMQNNKHYVCGKISKTCNYKIAVQPKQFRVAHLIRCIIELCV